MKKNERPRIFSYTDYRLFLQDSLIFRRGEGMPASYRWISQKAGFKSPNFVHLVVNGKRQLSESSIEGLSKALGLTSEEMDFLRDLVGFSKAKNSIERETFGRRISSYSQVQKYQPQLIDNYEYHSSWWNVALRELLEISPENKGWTIEELANALAPRRTYAQVAYSLSLLLRLGHLIELRGENLDVPNPEKVRRYFKTTKASLSTGDQVSSAAVTAYHKTMINMGAESIDRFPREQRNISSVTMGVSEKGFEEIVELVQNFRKVLLKKSEEPADKSKIIQINFQFFPLAIINGGEKL